MITHAPITNIRTNVNPAPELIAYFPMTQWIDDGSGGRTYEKVTVTSASAVDTSNDWVSGVSAEAWLVAELPIRVRSTGTIPAGLSASTQYYASKPTSDRVRFHTTLAAAQAGTPYVDITSAPGGGATITIYPSIVYDRSGQGNHILFGTGLNDTGASYGAWQKIATVPGMSSGTSASINASLGSISAAVFNARWNYEDYSMFISAYITPYDAIVTGGRSLLGCGFTGVSDGPRLQTGTDGAQFRGTMFYGGTGGSISTLTDTVVSALAVDTTSHIAVLWDSRRGFGHAWFNGLPDISIQYRDLTDGVGEVGTVSPAVNGFGIGGINTNCQAATWRDVVIASIPNTSDIDIPKMHRLVQTLSGVYGYCPQDGDFG